MGGSRYFEYIDGKLYFEHTTYGNTYRYLLSRPELLSLCYNILAPGLPSPVQEYFIDRTHGYINKVETIVRKHGRAKFEWDKFTNMYVRIDADAGYVLMANTYINAFWFNALFDLLVCLNEK